jgi:hypothetical protein
MLIVHLGLPETGVLALQSLMVKHSERLRAAGFIYPDRWQTRGAPSHNPLGRGVIAGAADEDLRVGQLPAVLQEFVDWFKTEQRHHVLLSSEVFGNCLNHRARGMLVRFLTQCAEHAPVRLLVWLRRADDLTDATYRTQSAAGTLRERADVNEFAAYTARWYAATMDSLAQVHDDTPDLTLAVLPYRSADAAPRQLCEALSLPADFLDANEPVPAVRALDFGAQAFLHHFDRLRSELRLACSRQDWANALEQRTITVDLPGPASDYSILSIEQRLSLHRVTLEASDKSTINEYRDYFVNEEASGPPQRSLVEVDFTAQQFESIQQADQELAKTVAPSERRRR